MRVKSLLSYDGTRYFGWQKTKTGPSIQEALEIAFQQILQQPIPTEAASRTDRGVHARGQVVHFDLPLSNLPKLHRQLNGVLPHDIRILSLEEMPDLFHSTLDARSKEYHYFLCLDSVQLPMHLLYSWCFHKPLDLDEMARTAPLLIGTHDFTSFTSEAEENPICTISKIEFLPLPHNRLRIALHGNRFLYKMARTLVGTLVYASCGKLAKETIPFLLGTDSRPDAGMTAPAHGLFLHQVFY